MKQKWPRFKSQSATIQPPQLSDNNRSSPPSQCVLEKENEPRSETTCQSPDEECVIIVSFPGSLLKPGNEAGSCSLSLFILEPL